MEIFKFIKWKWNRVSRDDKLIGLVGLSTVLGVVIAMYMGLTFIPILLSGVGCLIGSIIVITVCDHTIRNWKLFKKMQEEEAQRVVDKLRGGSTKTSGFF